MTENVLNFFINNNPNRLKDANLKEINYISHGQHCISDISLSDIFSIPNTLIIYSMASDNQLILHIFY